MINYDDLVEITWSPSNLNYYVDKGYTYTKTRDKFMVKIKDLAPNSHIKYPVMCDICGETFYTNNNSLNRNKSIKYHACVNCRIIKSAQTRISNNIDFHWEKLEKICDDKGYKLITTKDEYRGYKTQIYYECPKHGEQHGSYSNLVGGHGCIKCKHEHIANLQRNSFDKVKKIIEEKNNNILLNPQDYIRSWESNLNILCGCCKKNIFTVSFSAYKHGIDRCNFCSRSMSKGELIIHNYLKENNIRFEQEKTFPDCRDKGLLVFDFYLPDYNECFEFDGEQHYNIHYDVTMKNDDPDKSFETRIRHDRMKDEYCDLHGIKMFRISYKDENKINKLLDKELGIFK